MPSHGRQLKTTKTSLDILELIKSMDEATVTQVAERTDHAKSTVLAHLNTLQEAGYLTRYGDEYHPSLRLFHFGVSMRNNIPGFHLARRATKELAQATEEQVSFLVEVDGRMLLIYNTAGGFTRGFEEGEFFPMHSGATGKAILAEYPEERVVEIIDEWGLPQYTASTITNEDELDRELADIRERGYGVNDQEATEGLKSFGMPIKLQNGAVFGGISVGGPSYKLSQDTVKDEIVSELRHTIDELEDILKDQDVRSFWNGGPSR
jgi:DNA-binding IclR family transcriptional regulator